MSTGANFLARFCFTLGDCLGIVVNVDVFDSETTLGVSAGSGGATGTGVVVGATLCDSTPIGFFVALFNIYARWMYALVVGDPYSSVGMLRLGSCKMASKSEAVCCR